MEQMEAKIEDLEQRKAARDKMRYSEAFKADATAVVRRLRKGGLTKSRISDWLDIPWVTLARCGLPFVTQEALRRPPSCSRALKAG